MTCVKTLFSRTTPLEIGTSCVKMAILRTTIPRIEKVGKVC